MVATIVASTKLTPDQKRDVVKWADAAFYGDRSCTEENLRRACFAIERCTAPRPQFPGGHHVRSLLAAKHGLYYVAVDAGQILGILCVAQQRDSDFLYAFCVAEAHRGSGVGKSLLDHVVQTHGANRTLELTVVHPKPWTPRTPMTAWTALQAQHDRLVVFYRSFGFRAVDYKNNETVMRRAPGRLFRLPAIYRVL
jgi:GNAT superfamily N-acetyltransferase